MPDEQADTTVCALSRARTNGFLDWREFDGEGLARLECGGVQ